MVRRKQKAEEATILQTLRTTFPSFLPEVCFVPQETETPDFLGRDQSGRIIGLELTRWLDIDQTAAAVKRERIREAMLTAINCQVHSRPENISSAIIFPRWGKDLEGRHAQIFSDQFHSLAIFISDRWDTLKSAHWRQLLPEERFDYEVHLNDHKEYATLARYVSSIWFREPDRASYPLRRDSWVSVIPDGGFYQTESSIQALKSVIERKFIHYHRHMTKGSLAARNLHRLFLLVYTDPDRFSSNTSYQTPDQMMKSPTEGLVEAAQQATGGVGILPRVFDGVFLFYSAWGALWLAEIWPHSRIFPVGDR